MALAVASMLNKTSFATLLVAVLSMWIVGSENADGSDGSNISFEEFDVKPGGMVQEHELSWQQGEFSCKFIYACQGGTNEKWFMTLKRSDNGQDWSCQVERPGGTSYLYFQQFKMEVTGATLQSTEVQGPGGAPLNPSEYVEDATTNSVSHVEGKFGSQLSMVNIHGGVPRGEL